jgi:hypothetical protein
MIKILLGLVVIIGLIVAIFALKVICGLIGIFLTNLFSSTSYTTYNWDNIRHETGKGLAILILIIGVFFVAYMFGELIIV